MSSKSSGKAYATKTARDPHLAERLWEKSVGPACIDTELGSAA